MAGSLYLGSQKVCPVITIGSGGKVYNTTVEELLGEIDDNGVLNPPAQPINVVFDGVTALGNNALLHKFYNNIKIQSASFPDLVSATGSSCMYGCFYESTITNLDLSKLEEIGSNCLYSVCYYSNLQTVDLSSLKTVGKNGLYNAFSGTLVEEINFQSLEEIGEKGLYECFSESYIQTANFTNLITLNSGSMQNAFYMCEYLEDVYFNSLKTTSFNNTNAFYGMLSYTGTDTTHTLHFPSNLESTIQGLGGYPRFGGSNGYVVLAFDLPATE